VAFPWAAEESLGAREKISLLRKSYRARVLELGARDCVQGIDVFESLRRWSDVATSSVATALSIAREIHHDLQRPGIETGASTVSRDASATRHDSSTDVPLAVLALGRLGLSEFDLGSDADLIFITPAHTDPDGLLGATRLGEKMIETLSSYTRDGAVFAVDTRLRPRGSEGELVVTEDAFLDYAAQAAQPWEALTYLKACPVAGDWELGCKVTARVIGNLFERFAHDSNLSKYLQEMRLRLEKEPRPRLAVTKTAAGGYYDIDFVISYLRFRHRLTVPPGANMIEQIAALRAAGGLADADARSLSEGAFLLRAVDHAARIVTGKPPRGWPERQGHAEGVRHLLRLWGFVKIEQDENSLRALLTHAQQELRAVYSRLLTSE